MHNDAPHLDGQYAAFGKLTDGFDVLDRIAGVATDFRSDRPLEEQKMKSVTIVEE
jgi:peptidyl-prolyl cis-trans isomerase B (cyclophilin B)